MRLSEIVKEDTGYQCDLCVKYFDTYDERVDHLRSVHGDTTDEKHVELDEIKVTKTVAGKRASASQTLAGKLKKKMPNQGKKPVELDKMKDAKELANNLLKGQYKS